MTFEEYGLKSPDILLPDERVDMEKWAVIACDQFTSQKDYWRRVEDFVGGSPSALNLIYPEAWLDQGAGRIGAIQAAMLDYEKNVVTRRVSGFILTEREVEAGLRIGLIALVDLEKYDYRADSRSLIRATEGTIESRIPPRVLIRKDAPMELSHILLLADDPDMTLIEPLYDRRSRYEKLYDFRLMEGGGRIRGWRVDDAEALDGPLKALMEKSGGLLFAVGDGNHSLATAKRCWEDIKSSLAPGEAARHPARWAMVEIDNIHSPGMAFEPIHRALFHADMSSLRGALAAWLEERGMRLSPARDEGMFAFLDASGRAAYGIEGLKDPLPLRPLQAFLDDYLAARGDVTIDYIHGRDALEALARDGAVCIELPGIDKSALFPSVRQGGPLPRKTFSLGEARDKRYYLECRKIK